MERELEKLEVNLGGVSSMTRLPDAVVVIDPKREAIATKEVNKLGLPLIGLCDTNCDPDEVEYLIPGNDDAIRSCNLILGALATGINKGRGYVPQEPAATETVAAAAEAPAEAPAAAAPAEAPAAEAPAAAAPAPTPTTEAAPAQETAE